MKNKIPLLLIYFRLAISFCMLYLAWKYQQNFKFEISILILIGFLSDVFDGIIARKLGVSTSALRKFDTIADRIFFICVLLCCFLLHSTILSAKLPQIVLVLTLDLLVFGISFLRFRKSAAAHNLLSKMWGILLLISLLEIILSGTANFFNVMIVAGILSRLDSILIYCILKKYDYDIPSCYHAHKINKGEYLKKNVLLNC